jgi:hypothetical protein
MFEFEHNPPIDAAALVELFARSGWEEAESRLKLEWAIAASHEWVTCTVEGELVAFGRSYELDALRKLVFDVVVDERYQGYGLADEIVLRLAANTPGMQEVALFKREDVGTRAGTREGEGRRFSIPEAPAGAYLG